MSTTAKKNSTRKEQSNPPVDKIRVGLVTASIWERETAKGAFYAVTFERRYRDSEGSWHTSHSYGPQDLLSLAKAANLAHTRVLELQADN